jgi:hypothetical protein
MVRAARANQEVEYVCSRTPLAPTTRQKGWWLLCVARRIGQEKTGIVKCTWTLYFLKTSLYSRSLNCSAMYLTSSLTCSKVQ